MISKRFIALCFSVVLIFSLAACGQNNGASGDASTEATNNVAESENTETPEVTEEDTQADAQKKPYEGATLTVGIWGGNDSETRAINQVKDDFEALTGAKVEFKIYTDYNTQIEADFVAKTAPDAFYVDSSVADYIIDLGVLEALDDTELSTADYSQNVLNAFVRDGVTYAIPKDLSSLARYINVGILEELGMSVSDIPNDLEDYVAFLPELQAKLDEKYGKGKITAMSANVELARILHILDRNGASVITEDGRAQLENDAVMKNMEIFEKLYATGAFKTAADIGAGWNGEAFGTGQCVIMEEGNWVYGTLKNDYSDIKFEVIDMPNFEGTRSSMIFTVGYGVYANSANKELAKEWIKYATGAEGMYTWCSNVGTLPSRKDLAESMAKTVDKELTVHLNQIPVALPWQMGMYGSTISDAYNNFSSEAFKGKITMKDALTQADKQANTQIDNQ